MITIRKGAGKDTVECAGVTYDFNQMDKRRAEIVRASVLKHWERANK
jgi:hypothetical protein